MLCESLRKEVRPLGRDNGGRINELKAKLSAPGVP